MVLALMMWRSVFAVLHRRPLLRGIAVPHHHDSALDQRFLILERAFAGVIPENGVAALTGATQTDNRYVLDVGETRFHVRDRYVRRLRDPTSPECGYDQTCFYSMHKGMPEEEEIATVLLQLKNNPALFDKWAMQNGLAFKADGRVFTPAP